MKVKVKEHIKFAMLSDFQNMRIDSEISKRGSSFYGKSVITDHQVKNWFSSDDMSVRCLTYVRTLSKPQLRWIQNIAGIKTTRELTLNVNVSQSTICCHLEKEEQLSRLSI